MATPAPETSAERGIPALAPVPPVLIAVTAIVSIQFGAALGATLLDRIGPAGISTVRLTLAALVLLVVWRPWKRTYSRRALRLAAVFGLVLGAMNMLFFYAIARIPLGVTVTIEFLGPITVAAVFSRRRLHLLWCGLALLGVVLLAQPWRSGADALDAVGVACAAAAAVLWGVYILLAERTGREFDGSDGLAIAMVWAAALAFVPGVVDSGSELLDPVVLAVGLGVSLLSTVIPYTLETEALRRIPPGVFGILMSLEPGIAALAGLLVLGETLGAVQLLAIALVVAASVGVTRSTRVLDTPAAPLDA